jgi:hypothetical protein
MEKVQNPSNSVCYTPSSEPFRKINEVHLFNEEELLVSFDARPKIIGATYKEREERNLCHDYYNSVWAIVAEAMHTSVSSCEKLLNFETQYI